MNAGIRDLQQANLSPLEVLKVTGVFDHKRNCLVLEFHLDAAAPLPFATTLFDGNSVGSGRFCAKTPMAPIVGVRPITDCVLVGLRFISEQSSVGYRRVRGQENLVALCRLSHFVSRWQQRLANGRDRHGERRRDRFLRQQDFPTCQARFELKLCHTLDIDLPNWVVQARDGKAARVGSLVDSQFQAVVAGVDDAPIGGQRKLQLRGPCAVIGCGGFPLGLWLDIIRLGGIAFDVGVVGADPAIIFVIEAGGEPGRSGWAFHAEDHFRRARVGFAAVLLVTDSQYGSHWLERFAGTRSVRRGSWDRGSGRQRVAKFGAAFRRPSAQSDFVFASRPKQHVPESRVPITALRVADVGLVPRGRSRGNPVVTGQRSRVLLGVPQVDCAVLLKGWQKLLPPSVIEIG